jgi:hypothetical protein
VITEIFKSKFVFISVFFSHKQKMLSRSPQLIARTYSSGSVPKVHAVASKGFNLQTDAYGKNLS